MSHGYNGKILHVNLTSGQLSVEEPSEAFYRKYMGGSALAMHYLLKEVPAGVDPLGPDNVLIRKLLSFVPDVLFIEGNKAYLVNPLSSDSSTYSYGSDHPIYEGRYQVGAWKLNRVQVEGYDNVAGAPVIVDSLEWGEINKLYDKLQQLFDMNIDSVVEAQQRGEAYLREAEIESASGIIRIPTSCGQQLYDVIDITDSRAGLSAAKKRVLGLTLVYQPSKAQYEQRLASG